MCVKKWLSNVGTTSRDLDSPVQYCGSQIMSNPSHNISLFNGLGWNSM